MPLILCCKQTKINQQINSSDSTLTIVEQVDSPMYHTYYGNINIDSMQAKMWDIDGCPCYIVQTIEKDSFIWNGVIKYLPSPAIIYYCPQKDTYYHVAPDNQGMEIVSEYNPKTRNLEWLNN